MTNEEALKLRVGERIHVRPLPHHGNDHDDQETFTVKTVVHSPDYRAIWVLTSDGRSFHPAEIERHW